MTTCFNTINQVILESFCCIEENLENTEQLLEKNLNKELKKK